MGELTEDQVRENFIEHIRDMVEYWSDEKREVKSIKERLNGLAFSILSSLDGCSSGIPGFIVAPLPHKDDREYKMKKYGEDAKWYPENHDSDVNCDIAGSLHEQFYK